MLLAAETASQYAFDAARDNTAMLVMGVVVVITWLAFRKMIQLSERKPRK